MRGLGSGACAAWIVMAGLMLSAGVSIGLGVGQAAYADQPELLGEMRFKEFVLRPSLRLIRSNPSPELFLQESSLAWQWALSSQGGRQKGPNLSAHFRLGGAALRGQPIMYPQSDLRGDPGLGFVESFGMLRWVYGELSIGLLPLGYGLGGAMSEGELILPRSMLFSQQVVGLRDYGLSWYSSHNGYFTRQVIHQGEAGPNRDGLWWYTGTWGWSDLRSVLAGVSAQKGRTGPESTNFGEGVQVPPQREKLGGAFADFDPVLDSEWQQASIFLALGQPARSWQVKSQWTYGRRIQGEQPELERESNFQAFNVDLSYAWKDRWMALARYDRLEDLRYWTAGFALRSHQDTSTFIFLFSEQMPRSGRADQRERRAEILWRIFPLAHSL